MATMPVPSLYTTDISVSKTIGEITEILVQHGASRIAAEYDGAGMPVQLGFQMKTAAGPRWFYLPSDVDKMQKRLIQANERDSRVAKRQTTREHAARVAWRIIKQWIVAQLEMIETGQITLEHAMLAWVEVGEPGSHRLLHHEMEERSFTLPPMLPAGRTA